MFDLLPNQLPWFVAGPALGLLVVALFGLANQPLGASGAYVQTAGWLRRRSGIATWRVWYFVGMFLGGLLVTQVLRDDSPVRSGYDALRDAFPLWFVIPLVFTGSVLLGYGAGLAGGCTSGHMMSGMMQTAISGYIFAAGAFAAAVPTAILMFRKEA